MWKLREYTLSTPGRQVHLIYGPTKHAKGTFFSYIAFFFLLKEQNNQITICGISIEVMIYKFVVGRGFKATDNVEICLLPLFRLGLKLDLV